MATLAENSVDAIVTDPPYGLKFMGKDWDHGVPGAHFWIEALRVAKPGCHLLAFGGTRTFHRLACAIEDAGWELRDTVMWVYGSGFPKSLDVSKAIDKVNGEVGRLLKFTAWMRTTGLTASQVNSATDTFMGSHYLTDKSQPAIPTPELWSRLRPLCGDVPPWVDELVERIEAEREVVGKHDAPAKSIYSQGLKELLQDVDITAPATNAAKQWEGWGTALKPAIEYIVCAQKPLHLSGHCGILALKIKEAICQLSSSAKVAGTSSLLSQNAQGAVCDSALWGAVEGCNTLEDLYALMDTLPLESVIPLSLSTALSWLNILGAISQSESTFTTEMVSSLITDLKILNSLPSPITPDAIIEAAIGQHGTGSSASLAGSIFNVVAAKLSSILTPFAPGLATSKDGEEGLHPDWRPIILARKPFDSTVAENVQRWGTGAMNIDGCRVEGGGLDYVETKRVNEHRFGGASTFPSDKTKPGFMPSTGRWPANLVHDGSDEVLELFPKQAGAGAPATGPTHSGKFKSGSRSGVFNGMDEPGKFHNDSGSAARFFYCAKASKRDRDEGLDSMCTVKYIWGTQPRGLSCKDVSMALVQSLQRVTSDQTVTWFIGEFGESIMGLCRQDSLSTILTAIDKTTTSEILNLLPLSIINAFTQDACYGVASGGSHVVSVVESNESQPITTNGSAELVRGVNLVVSRMLSQISVAENWKPLRNIHSTVKPTELMRYLCRLVTPPKGVILDPFMGSGSTGKAAILEGFDFIGIEKEAEYVEIARARIDKVIWQGKK